MIPQRPNSSGPPQTCPTWTAKVCLTDLHVLSPRSYRQGYCFARVKMGKSFSRTQFDLHAAHNGRNHHPTDPGPEERDLV